MPLPKPRKDENMNEFITRCVTDEKFEKEEPDSEKRLAICYSQWENRNKE